MRTVYLFILVSLSSAALAAQEPVDLQVIAQIKMEGFQRSQLMDTLGQLTDGFGPRLKGSPAYRAAAEWCRNRLANWGLDKAQLEPVGYAGPGWSLKRYSLEMSTPHYLHINAIPAAWSPSTPGMIAAPALFADVSSPQDFEKYKGKLKGVIVLNGRPAPRDTRFEPVARRFTDSELKRAETNTDPAKAAFARFRPTPYPDLEKVARQTQAGRAAIARFFRDEGVAAVLTASSRDPGVVRVAGAGGFDMTAPGFQFMIPNPSLAAPTFVVSSEHYGRMLRLMDRKIPVMLEVNLDATQHPSGQDSNVLAEITGSDPKLKDELVMLGAHLDSWHAGTGATDNAAGSAVMMEAMRILKAIGVRPRRTIRVALWSGEEGGLHGSLGHVRTNFGDPETMQLTPLHSRLSAYFNFDHGTGRIRGVYLQGNEAVRPIFDAWLQPFHYMGASTLAVDRTGGSDYVAFDFLGLPAFPFIQDEIDYDARTHHSNMDVYESVVEEDVKQAAVIIASFAYHTAMRDEKLPRRPLPAAARK